MRRPGDLRRLGRGVLALLLVAVAAGALLLRDDEGGPRPLDRATLSFLDPRADLVARIVLDDGTRDREALEDLVARALRTPAARTALAEVLGGDAAPADPGALLDRLAALVGLGGDDVRALLRGDLLVGARSVPGRPLRAADRDLLERVAADDDGVLPGEEAAVERALDRRDAGAPATEVVAALRVRDRAALDAVLAVLDSGAAPLPGVPGARRVAEGVALVGGTTVVAVLDGGRREADVVLAERVRGGVASGARGPAAPPLDGEHLVSARLTPTALGSVLDADALRRVLRDTAPGRALRGATVTLDVAPNGVAVKAAVDLAGTRTRDLPLGPPAPLDLPRGEGIASASADQQFTTVFLSRLARVLVPDSRFVRRAEAIERRLGVRFEEEVLRAFSGPSVSVLRPDGDGDGGTAFAARSSLRDPARMRALLPRLAPSLPGLLEGLEGLGSTGLTALLLLAPDAPLTPTAGTVLAAAPRARPVPAAPARAGTRSRAPGAPPLLFELRGTERIGAGPRVIYGVVGDAFVVGSTRALALAAARIPTTRVESAATRTRVDVPALLRRAPALRDDPVLGVLAVLLPTVDVEASAVAGDVVASAVARTP